MHPAHMRKPFWRRVWLRLCPFIVEGGTVGTHGFFTRNGACDFFYHSSNKNETHAPIKIYRKRVGAKPE
jgi:hypothetical protein